MAECDQNDTMPGRCVEAFSSIQRTLGQIDGKLDAIKDISARQNGDVANHTAQIGLLSTRVGQLEVTHKDLKASRSVISGRVWIIAVVILTAILTTIGRYIVSEM